MAQDESISPINGLNIQEFEAIRDQIIEYIKMYKTDGEPIGAYKIMKLFEPFLEIKYNPSIKFSDWVSDKPIDEAAGSGYDFLGKNSKAVIDIAVERFVRYRLGLVKRSAEKHRRKL